MDATHSGTPAGRIVTFYSYKGGTGRSMALANVAWILAAKRQRVLVLDWDLEAPGLHRYFRPFLIDKYLTSSDGLIDFVMEFADQVIAPAGPSEQPSPDWYVPYANITRYALSVNFGEFPPPGKIDLIPAGRQGPAYATRVSSFNWQNLYDRLGGGAFFEAVKAHMRRDYDYILIDSRTGVSDTAGICTVQMPDALVVCFTYNNQSMEGAAAVAHSSVQGRRKFLGTSRNNAFNVFPVPTRVEQAEQQKLGIRQRYARRLFSDLLAPGIDRDAYWSSVEVPYVPFHGYEETLAPFTDDPNDTKKILRAMINIAAYLTEVKVKDFTFTFPISPELKSEVLLDFAATPDAADTDQSVAGPTKETALEELVRVAEAHYLHLPREQQEEARRVWTRLVHVVRPDEGVGHSRQRINLQAFGATATPLVRALAQTTLLSLTRDDTSGEETVVIDNEALIGAWSRLRGWLDKDLDFLFWRQRLRDPIQDWEASGYKNDFLLRGAPLRTAQQWASDHGAELNDAEQAFINRAVQMSLAASSHSDDRRPRAAILRPFGRRQEIDFDEVERSLILPALERLGISGRSIQILEAGNIRADMFQQLVAAQIVIADVSIDNANVFYELGLRHALQPNRTFLLRARSRKGPGDRGLRDEVPFDLRTDRYLEYEPDTPAGKLEPLTEALRLTLANDQSDSPVFQMLPNLEGQDRSRLLPVPQAFREAVQLAFKGRQLGLLSLLAMEAEECLWASEGLRVIGRAQFNLRAYLGAKATWEKLQTLIPEEPEANHRLSTIYQRLGDLDASDRALQRVLSDKKIPRDLRAESLSLLARNIKVRWRSSWQGLSGEPASSAALASPHLFKCYELYRQGFQESLDSFYAGLNALSMLTITLELAERDSVAWETRFDSDGQAKTELDGLKVQRQQLAGAVAISLDARKDDLKRSGREDRWVDISAADLLLLTGNRPTRIAFAYRSALRDAPDFYSDSARSQLEIFQHLGVLRENRRRDGGGQTTLTAAAGDSATRAPDPFVSHAMDAPGQSALQFPIEKEPAARQKIVETVKAEMALPDGVAYGFALGVSGGDILFHEVCEALGIKTQLFLPEPAFQFVNDFLKLSGPSWVERFTRRSQVLPTRVLADSAELPRWILEKPGYSIWQRTRYWMLFEAIAEGGADNVTVIAVWDGDVSAEGFDGPKDLLQKASELGAKAIAIPSLLLDTQDSK